METNKNNVNGKVVRLSENLELVEIFPVIEVLRVTKKEVYAVILKFKKFIAEYTIRIVGDLADDDSVEEMINSDFNSLLEDPKEIKFEYDEKIDMNVEDMGMLSNGEFVTHIKSIRSKKNMSIYSYFYIPQDNIVYCAKMSYVGNIFGNDILMPGFWPNLLLNSEDMINSMRIRNITDFQEG